MSGARVTPARLRTHSQELGCDVSRRIGFYVRYPNGEEGRRHKTRSEAAAEARWFNGNTETPR